jgi:hypothetical protein
MATSSKIKIMISSRCNDPFPLASKPVVRLSDIRRQIKKKVEAERILGETPYEVWINEDAVADASQDSWEACMSQARDCDILVALFNGNAGWTGKDGTVGICHAEYQTAWEQAPGKTFAINISEPSAPTAPSSAADKLFQAYMERANRFIASAKDGPALEAQICRTIAKATVMLVQRGTKDTRRGSGYLGPSLEWNRLGYAERSNQMIAAARLSLAMSKSRKAETSDRICVRTISDKRILFALGAVPDSMSVTAAREMVGQPHLDDHLLAKRLAAIDGGPVHLVACHKAATAAQSQRMLGFPNATVVAAPFGIYVFDPVQAIQLVLVSGCGDEIATRHGIQKFLEWLDQSDQRELLVRGAQKRKAIVAALASGI